MKLACTFPDMVKIATANFGGKLGPHQFKPQEIMKHTDLASSLFLYARTRPAFLIQNYATFHGG